SDRRAVDRRPPGHGPPLPLFPGRGGCRIMNRRVRLALGLFTATALLIGLSRAGSPQKATVPPLGSHAFRHICNLFRLQPLPSIKALLRADPNDVVLVVFGDTAALDDVALATGGLPQFVNKGGALLVATDRPDGGRLNGFGVTISGVQVHQDPQKGAYHGKPACPWLTDGLGTRHPLFQGLTRGLATNQPSFIAWRERTLSRLAGFPPDCFHEIPLGKKVIRLFVPTNADYAVGSRANDQPRVLILAGHGVFLNSMLAQRDNDNFLFAC